MQTITAVAARNTIITSRITVVEVVSALQRKQREGTLTTTEIIQLTTDFLAVCTHEYTLVETTTAILDRAQTLVQNYPLKAYDAVQLASALFANAALQSVGIPALTFVAGDNQLLRAAEAEGLSVENPLLYP